MGVLDVLHHDAAADVAGRLDGRGSLGDHGSAARALVRIHRHDAPERCALGGMEVKLIALRADEVVERIPVHEQRLRRRARVAQVHEHDPVLLRPLHLRDDQVVPVLGHARLRDARRLVLMA